MFSTCKSLKIVAFLEACKDGGELEFPQDQDVLDKGLGLAIREGRQREVFLLMLHGANPNSPLAANYNNSLENTKEYEKRRIRELLSRYRMSKGE